MNFGCGLSQGNIVPRGTSQDLINYTAGLVNGGWLLTCVRVTPEAVTLIVDALELSDLTTLLIGALDEVLAVAKVLRPQLG